MISHVYYFTLIFFSATEHQPDLQLWNGHTIKATNLEFMN